MSTSRALGALPLLAVLVACAPILLGGYPQGHDWGFQLVRIAEYRHALAEGQGVPFWASNLYGGYGSPVFLFYAPGHALLGALASLLPIHLTAAAALGLVVTAGLGALCMRILGAAVVRDEGPAGRAAARCGVYVFVLAPYLLADSLVRNADAEYLGLSLLPLALAGLLTVGRDPLRGAFLLGLGGGAVVLSHNLTALVLAVLLPVGAVVLYAGGSRRTWAHLGLGGGLAALLGAVLWVPALALSGWLRTAELQGGTLRHADNFSPPAALVTGEFFSVGAVGVAVWVGAIVLALRTRPGRDARLLGFAWLIGGGSLVLQLAPGLWDVLPGLSLFQFPWRFMGPLALAGAMVVVLGSHRLFVARPGRSALALEAVVFVACVAGASPQLAAYLPLAEEDPARVEAAFAPEALRQSSFRVTVGDEYLPARGVPQEVADARWRSVRPTVGPLVPRDGRTAELLESGRRTRLRVESAAAGSLSLARWAFPVWETRVDGAEVASGVYADGGLTVPVPKGTSLVELRLRRPPSRRVGMLLSGLGVLGLGYCARRARHGPAPGDR